VIYKRAILASALIVVVFALGAQETVSDAAYRKGLATMKNGDYAEAAAQFRSVAEDPALVPFHGDALIWLAKAELALGREDEATLAVDRFMANWESHPSYPEAVYLRGRLLFMDGEGEKAIILLKGFLGSWPQHALAPAALYWTGESLLSIGYLAEADSIFSELLDRWPGSVKREAARYRRAEIELKYRERELLELLKWSHEEYLKNSEEFYRKEREYEEALAAYQERLSDKGGVERTLLDKTRLLNIKARALALKTWYVEELRRIANER
jgi:outer membrane protein assembly factor BamD (BamD/ComL family)